MKTVRKRRSESVPVSKMKGRILTHPFWMHISMWFVLVFTATLLALRSLAEFKKKAVWTKAYQW